MAADNTVLTTFTTRMRQLILQYKEALRDKQALTQQLSDKDKEMAQLHAQITQMQHNYESLRMAKMLTITDGDLDTAKNRVAKILRDINRCITLLNEQA